MELKIKFRKDFLELSNDIQNMIIENFIEEHGGIQEFYIDSIEEDFKNEKYKNEYEYIKDKEKYVKEIVYQEINESVKEIIIYEDESFDYVYFLEDEEF